MKDRCAKAKNASGTHEPTSATGATEEAGIQRHCVTKDDPSKLRRAKRKTLGVEDEHDRPAWVVMGKVLMVLLLPEGQSQAKTPESCTNRAHG